MAAAWDGGNSKTLERVGMGVWMGRAVGRKVAGITWLLLCGGGAMVAPLGVNHDLRRAGGLRGGGGWRQGLCTRGISHRFWGIRGGKEEFTSPYSDLFSFAFITRVIKKSKVSIVRGCRLYNVECQRHRMVLLSNAQHEQ